MILLKPYKNISETMKYLYIQIKDSLHFADQWLPGGIDTPEELFNILKANTVFVNDGNNEILQRMQTLMSPKNNVWKISGAGDCDCFVIAASACMLVLNFRTKIILAGREKAAPIHIYNLVFDRGSWRPFDLTNNYYDSERKYKFTQVLPELK